MCHPHHHDQDSGVYRPHSLLLAQHAVPASLDEDNWTWRRRGSEQQHPQGDIADISPYSTQSVRETLRIYISAAYRKRPTFRQLQTNSRTVLSESTNNADNDQHDERWEDDRIELISDSENQVARLSNVVDNLF